MVRPVTFFVQFPTQEYCQLCWLEQGVFMGPIGSEELRPDPGPKLDQVQILLSLIGAWWVYFYCYGSVCQYV